LDFNLVYMARKLRHKPKTLMGVQDSILLSGSPNRSNNGEIRIYPAAQTLFSVQPISRVLEVQMHRFFFFFVGKLRQFPRIFMTKICLNSDVSNDVLFRQEDKDCHQVKMWPLTQQLVIKSIVLNFGL
jgi:hypothetical protein